MNITDERAVAFKERLIRLEQERRDNAEAKKDLVTEMKSANLLKEEIDGIKLAVKRHFETPEKKTHRESVEAIADAIGDFKTSPLGSAAIERASRDDGAGFAAAKRAAKRFVDGVKRGDHDVTISMSGHEPIHIQSERRSGSSA